MNSEYWRRGLLNLKKFKHNLLTKKMIYGIIKNYVIAIEIYEQEFALKSPADKLAKDKEPKPVGDSGGEGCHWVTLDHGPVCID